ncbi:hypothetical protein AVEN_6961-1 [Araneus ventricosus]|uniref:Uncharacterized protein n=1 Tax=Araneus ventricosus TaxID=182803 RepID=A0A4Y2WCZ3_ARAVE|nr:hypothetical protein AVEN_6961-1 [Araneus ventricosus]
MYHPSSRHAQPTRGGILLSSEKQEANSGNSFVESSLPTLEEGRKENLGGKDLKGEQTLSSLSLQKLILICTMWASAVMTSATRSYRLRSCLYGQWRLRETRRAAR